MPAEPDEPAQRRCPVCWTTFTLSPRNPNKRYCCPACRMQDWRRRHDAELTAAIPVHPAPIRAAHATEAEGRKATDRRHAHQERRSAMNPD